MARSIKFYRNTRGDSPVEAFLNGLSVKARTKCLSYLNFVAEHGNALPANYIKHIQGDLWEVRPEYGGMEYSFFYVLVTTEAVAVLHAFTKKTQKTPTAEITRALSRLAEVQEEAEVQAQQEPEPPE